MSIRILFFLCAFSTLAALHVLFLQFALYDSIAWLDIPIHFFGGAIVGLGLLAISDLAVRYLNRLRVHSVAIVSLFVIVLAWEVFGYLYLGSSMRSDYLSDTIVDIVAGLSGGMIGLYVGRALAVLNE